MNTTTVVSIDSTKPRGRLCAAPMGLSYGVVCGIYNYTIGFCELQHLLKIKSEIGGEKLARRYWLPSSEVQPLSDAELAAMSTEIKDMLGDMRLTQVWLVQKLAEAGMQTDKSELCSILSGTRKGAKCTTVLWLSAEILKEERSKYGRSETENNM